MERLQYLASCLQIPYLQECCGNEYTNIVRFEDIRAMGRGVINIPHADNRGYKFYCLDLAWRWRSAELLAVLIPHSMASFTVYY